MSKKSVLLDVLNSREIATAIWLGILFVWASFNADIRKSLLGVLESAFAVKIAIPLILLLINTLLSVCLLNLIGLWEYHQIKNTALWFFSTAIVSLFSLPKIASDHGYFRNAIKDNLKIIVLLQFILTFYTFSLLGELIFLPCMAFIGMMLAVSKNDEKYEKVNKLLSFIFQLISLFIVIFTGYKLVTEFGDFAKGQTFFDLVVPVLLSFLLLPYIWILSVYMNYESVFIRLQFLIKDKSVLFYAKKQAIINFHLRVSDLKRWASTLYYGNTESQSSIDISIREIQQVIGEEKSPTSVNIELGWSPYKAGYFLEEEGIKTGHYKKIRDNEWCASSPYLEIGSGRPSKMPPNNIAYYLEGDFKAVQRLKLCMNINQESVAELSHQKFLKCASRLHEMALNNDMSEQISLAIVHGGHIEVSLKSKIVRVVTDRWQNGKGYGVSFVIETT